MKQTKVYNVIFPIWIIMFFPPIVLITIFGNFLIDSLVAVLCFYVFRLRSEGQSLKAFYKKSIVKVWLFGFLADIVGAVFLFVVSVAGDTLGMPNRLGASLSYNPFESSLAVLIVIVAMLVSSICIFAANYLLTFRRLIECRLLRVKVCLAIAIITIPWTFLIPTEWFYRQF